MGSGDLTPGAASRACSSHRGERKEFVNHKASPSYQAGSGLWSLIVGYGSSLQSTSREGLRPDPHANQNSPGLEPIPKAVSAKRSFLRQLLREATRAIRAGDARTAELQQKLDEMAVLEHEMAETIRSERARADAAEERATAAEEHANCVEQRPGL